MNRGATAAGLVVALCFATACPAPATSDAGSDAGSSGDAGSSEDAGSDAGSSDAGQLDAGQDAGLDGGSDAGRTTGDLHLRFVQYFLVDGGMVGNPFGVSASVLKAYVNDAGTFVTYPAEDDPNGDGSWIRGVPPGPLVVRVDTRFIHTSQRDVRFEYRAQQRFDMRYGGLATTTTFQMTGLSPWQDEDFLEATAGNVGLFAVGLFGPDAGSTTFNPTIDWSQLPGIEASKGDTLVLSQLVARDAGQGVLRTIRNAAQLSFNQQYGQDTQVTAPFVSVPQVTGPTVSWSIAEFEAFRTQIHPTAQTNRPRISVQAQPAPISDGYLDGEFLGIYYSNPDAGSHSASLEYGNPFPPSWSVFATHFYRFAVDFTVGTNPTPIGFQVGFMDYGSLAQLGPVVAPAMGPVRSPQINGQSAFVDQSGVGITPRISWLPPAVGSPNAYTLYVYRLADPMNGGPPQAILDAWLETKETSIVLPPYTIGPSSQDYVVIIGASDRPGIDIEREPFKLGSPVTSSSVISGRLTY